MSLTDKIAEIEEEIANTKYNKATQHHIGKLKAKLAQLREDNIFKFGRLEQTVAKARKADEARAKADAFIHEEESYQKREQARKKQEQENIEFARDLRKREDVRQTEAMQRRAERNIQKEVGGQIVERGARTTTSVIDRSKGGGRIIKKNLFIIDPAEGFDVKNKMTSDGVEKFFLGDSNIRLNETSVGGRPVFEAQKSPALKRRIAKTLGLNQPINWLRVSNNNIYRVSQRKTKASWVQ